MKDVLTLDAEGKLTLPAEFRQRLSLRNGSKLRLAEEAGRLVLEPIGEREGARRQPVSLPLVDSPLQGPVPDHRDLREQHLERLSELD